MQRIICLCFVLIISACTSPANTNLTSVLWVQTAAEYQAACIQTYNTALLNLDALLEDDSRTAVLEQTDDYSELPPAIVFDLDQTVLDNSVYQARLIAESSQFEEISWDRWVQMAEAVTIAGAVDFIRHIQNKGIEPVFISNRQCLQRGSAPNPCDQKSDTVRNLANIGITGIKQSNVLLKNEYPDWGSEKSSRRKHVAENFRIIMLFGDDLGDFVPGVKKNITVEERKKLVSQHKDKWGTCWFILPNPMYGSWYRALDRPISKNLTTQ